MSNKTIKRGSLPRTKEIEIDRRRKPLVNARKKQSVQLESDVNCGPTESDSTVPTGKVESLDDRVKYVCGVSKSF